MEKSMDDGGDLAVIQKQAEIAAELNPKNGEENAQVGSGGGVTEQDPDELVTDLPEDTPEIDLTHQRLKRMPSLIKFHSIKVPTST
jgi:hypothetical protein